MQNLQNFFSDKKKLLLIAAVLGFVLLVLTASLTLLSNRSKVKKEPPKDQSKTSVVGQTGQKKTPTPKLIPEVDFKSWNGPDILTAAKTSSPVYTFKTSFSQEDVRNLANKLGTTGTIKEKPGYITVSDQNSLLVFNSKYGGYFFGSPKGIPLSEDTSNFVNRLTNDSTLQMVASYKKKNYGDKVTFFEFHRDWNRVGLPILNPLGVFNLPESYELRNLTFQTKIDNQPLDSNIYATSDGKDGLLRQDDFNTLTVGVSTAEQQPRIISIASSLRPLKTSVIETSSLISFADAKVKLQNKQHDFLMTVPAGSGTLDLAKVYPQNKAVAQVGEISECILVYLEKPPPSTQEKLAPSYLCRGEALLTNGYRVKVVATVSAVENLPNVLGASTVFAQESTPEPTDEDTSQKQGTFELRITPTTPQEPPPAEGCPVGGTSGKESASGYQLFAAWPDLGVSFDLAGGEVGSVFVRYDDQGAPVNLELAAQQIFDQLMGIAQNAGDVPSVSQIMSGIESFISSNVGGQGLAGCSVSISIASPTLFIYNKGNQEVEVKHSFRISYFDRTSDYIYYEYEKVKFERPDKGWLVERDNLDELALRIGNQLKLTSKEQERLLFELNHAAYDVSGNKLFIGLIPQEEVEQKLPLSISPQPNKVYRFHFYLSQALNSKPNPPTLNSLTRNSSLMIVELGAASQ